MDTAQRLNAALTLAQQEVTAAWPEVLAHLPTMADAIGLDITNAASVISHQRPSELAAISQEERNQLMEQLRAISVLPPNILDQTTTQELAAKLSYALHTSITFSVADQQLSYAYGNMQALDPSEKCLQPIWSDVGTSRSLRNAGNTSIEWGITISPRNLLPLLGLPSLQPWFMYQNVLIINPHTMKAVVGQIVGILSDRLHRYQFAASPAIVREGSFWSPGGRGRCIVCFIGDASAHGTVYTLDRDLRTKP